jgi:hypothetical protein
MGSFDDTGEIGEAAEATVTKHQKNKGYGYAMRTLFNSALERYRLCHLYLKYR